MKDGLFLTPTHGEGSLVIHLSHGDVGGGRIQQENLLIVAQLELRVEGVNNRNRPVGLLEGDWNKEPVGVEKKCSGYN